MAINNILGSIGFVITGAYDASKADYKFLNVVTFNNHVYVYRLRVPATAGTAPESTFTSNSTWFALLEGLSGHVADITGPDAITGAIRIEDSDGNQHDFNAGHKIQTDETSLTYRDKLNFKGDVNVIDNSTNESTDIYSHEIKLGTTPSGATSLAVLGSVVNNAPTTILRGVQGTTDEITVTPGTGSGNNDRTPVVFSAPQIPINKTNADASKVKTDFLTVTANTDLDTMRTDVSAAKAKTDLITITEEASVTPINLNTLNDDVEAIEKALKDSDESYISNLFTIPAPSTSWYPTRFDEQNVLISSTGEVTKNTNFPWSYNVSGEITGLPPLAYHEQGATVNGTGHVYINIGVVFSVKYHSAYIDIFDKLITKTVTDTSLPDVTRLFLINDSNERFTPYSEATDGSTNGITILKYDDPTTDLTKLYTITIPILESLQSSYDMFAEFLSQVKTHGIKVDYVHNQNDTLNSAKVKAEIAILQLRQKDVREQLSHYPTSPDVIAAPVGQILAKVLKTEPGAGNKSFMSFRVTKNSDGTDTLLMIVTYANTSPLDSTADIEVPIEILFTDTITDIASKLVSSFNTSVANAALIKFRDGYVKNGITYGGYTATSSGDTVTITSDNDGVIYNAGVALYEAVERFDNHDATDLTHGSGGPIEQTGFIDLPSVAPAFISTTAELTALRAGGYEAGTQFIVTGDDVEAEVTAATGATFDLKYTTATIANNITMVLTKTNGERFFTETVAGNPGIQEGFAYVFGYNTTNTDLLDPANGWGQGGGAGDQVWIPGDATGANREDYTAKLVQNINAIDADAGAQSTNNKASVTTGVTLQRNCTAEVITTDSTDDTVRVTRNTTGSVGAIGTAFLNGAITYTFTDGAAATNTTLVLNSSYIVLDATTLINLSTPGQVTVL